MPTSTRYPHRVVPKEYWATDRRFLTTKNMRPAEAVTWSFDIVANRLFVPVLTRYAAAYWTQHAENSGITKQLDEAGTSKFQVQSFDIMSQNGWKDIVARRCAAYAELHGIEIKLEAFQRRLYAVTHAERWATYIPQADLYITALGGQLEQETSCPILPGNVASVKEWYKVWLEEECSTAEARRIMGWITRFVYNPIPFDPKTCPEVIGKAYL